MASNLRFLYLGDIMGRPGREVVAKLLPSLKKKHKIDIVLAQAENVTHGKGMAAHHMQELQAAGVDIFTGGNHSLKQKSALALLDDPQSPTVAPLNMPGSKTEWGVKTFKTAKGDVQIICVLGTIFPGTLEVANPLKALDQVLEATEKDKFVTRIVNFHGDVTGEKKVVGLYMDGKVGAVIGDHWHIPTADAMVLPKGTAVITDVGMCGTLNSSLGVTASVIIDRWRNGVRNKNEIAEGPPYQLNGVVVECDAKTGLAVSIKAINLTVEKLG